MTRGTDSGTAAKGRAGELDFLKFVLICLMVVFHLVYIGDMYPYAKKIVYTFHMPAFLVISGYLANTRKAPKAFLRTMLWIFIPYAIMEGCYAVMASVLPIREHISHLSPAVLAEKIIVRPLGPYWYLYTLMLCSITYYAVFWLLKAGHLSRLIVLGLCFFIYSRCLDMLSLPCAMYFLAGAAVRQSGVDFRRAVPASALAIIPVILISMQPDCLDKSTAPGACMVYLSMSFLLFVFRHSGKGKAVFLFIGRNTMPVLLFSPVFTVLAKTLVPYLAFEPTGMLFAAVSLTFTLAGCFGITLVLDRTGLSRFFFGKAKELQ